MTDLELIAAEGCNCEVSCAIEATDVARFLGILDGLQRWQTDEIVEVVTALSGPHTPTEAMAALASLSGIEAF